MYKTKQLKNYNVSIEGEQLAKTENRWYYILRIDRFYGDDWAEGKHFYIKGYEFDNCVQGHQYYDYITNWLENVTESEIEQIFSHKKNHIFDIVPPTPAKLIKISDEVPAKLI